MERQTSLWIIAICIFLFSLIGVLMKGGIYTEGWFDFDAPVELPRCPERCMTGSTGQQVFSFIYAAPEGYHVDNCRIYYPEGVFLEQIDAEGSPKAISARTQAFWLVEGNDWLFLNCTNINDIGDMVYESEEVSLSGVEEDASQPSPNISQRILARIPVWLLVVVNIFFIGLALLAKTKKR